MYELTKRRKHRDGSIITDVKLKRRGDYSVGGYPYPFQEGNYWLRRSKENKIANNSNTNAQCKKLVKMLYDNGAQLVLIPGGCDDDYSEQMIILPGGDEDVDNLNSFIRGNLLLAKTYSELLRVINSELDIVGTFIVVDWSTSARVSSEFNRAFRYREDFDI